MSESIASSTGVHEPDTGAGGVLRKPYGLLVEFDTPEALLAAARRVRDAGFTRWDAYSPFAVRGLSEAAGVCRTRLPWLAFVCGLIGAGGGLLLQWWTNAVDYPLILSGKPLSVLPTDVPIAFELGVLAAALAAGVGMLVRNGLPRLDHALFADARFRRATTDGFFISIEASDPRFDEAATRTMLESLGGVTVQRVEEPVSAPVPRSLIVAGIILIVIMLIPPVLIVRARLTTSSEPRIHLIQDMDNQERFGPQSASALFEDGRAMRPTVRGTIARGEPLPDEHFHQGKVDGQWATTLPMPLADSLIARGQVRFKIYCSPCHGLDGAGSGPMARRAQELQEPDWVAPKSLLDPEICQRPAGQLFNTITDGVRNMVGFGDLIPEADRWAIIAHVRELQRRESAPIEDFPVATSVPSPLSLRESFPVRAGLCEPGVPRHLTGVTDAGSDDTQFQH